MVEIDLTNSIVQCLAARGQCMKMLEAIKTNTTQRIHHALV